MNNRNSALSLSTGEARSLGETLKVSKTFEVMSAASGPDRRGYPAGSKERSDRGVVAKSRKSRPRKN